jgi:hypothetical protein
MDVVRSNFEDVLPQIEKALQESEFVGKVYIYYIYAGGFLTVEGFL